MKHYLKVLHTLGMQTITSREFISDPEGLHSAKITLTFEDDLQLTCKEIAYLIQYHTDWNLRVGSQKSDPKVQRYV